MDTNRRTLVTCGEEGINDKQINDNFMQEKNVLLQAETEVNWVLSILKGLLSFLETWGKARPLASES